jgi:hypothetical protein
MDSFRGIDLDMTEVGPRFRVKNFGRFIDLSFGNGMAGFDDFPAVSVDLGQFVPGLIESHACGSSMFPDTPTPHNRHPTRNQPHV